MSERGSHCYAYPRPAVTVDSVIFTVRDASLQVLLIRRRKDPFAGRWAIPGGFLEMDETAEAGAGRELQEETGLQAPCPLHPIGFFDAPGRDPRGRTISLAFASVMPPPAPMPSGQDDAAAAAWVPVTELDASKLAFDHQLVLGRGLNWLREALSTTDVGLGLLPDPFSEEDVRHLFRLTIGSARGAAAWRRFQLDAGRIRAAGRDGTSYRIGKRPGRGGG